MKYKERKILVKEKEKKMMITVLIDLIFSFDFFFEFFSLCFLFLFLGFLPSAINNFHLHSKNSGSAIIRNDNAEILKKTHSTSTIQFGEFKCKCKNMIYLVR